MQGVQDPLGYNPIYANDLPKSSAHITEGLSRTLRQVVSDAFIMQTAANHRTNVMGVCWSASEKLTVA
jgi:hypothetical protein